MDDEALTIANHLRVAAYAKAFDLSEDEVISNALGLLIENLNDEETTIFGQELAIQIEKEN